MTETSVGYITPIGPALIQSLVPLLEALRAEPAKAPNDVQTSRNENGYSAAIIILTVVVFESAIGWIRYHKENAELKSVREENAKRKFAYEYFQEITSESSLAQDLEEVFVIRDVIVHSHLWEAQIVADENGTLRCAAPPTPPPKKLYGDQKFRNALDPRTRQSKRLQLNLFPSRIWRQDAYRVFDTVAQAFKSLQARDPRYSQFTNGIYGFKGHTYTFDQIIEMLADPS